MSEDDRSNNDGLIRTSTLGHADTEVLESLFIQTAVQKQMGGTSGLVCDRAKVQKVPNELLSPHKWTCKPHSPRKEGQWSVKGDVLMVSGAVQSSERFIQIR